MEEKQMDIAISDIQERVTERYGAIARRHLADQSVIGGCCGGSSCCSDASGENDLGNALALYTSDEIRDLPAEIVGATLGCGNPTAIASLKPGETVLDLGSGAGLDCFLSARRVGPTGHVIGLDMTDSMLELARRNQSRVGLDNVEFRKGTIEQMPVADASVDVIISNCVINLSADKDAVFREAYRVLKPGGRFAVSDVVTRGEVPPEFRQALDLWAGCLSGALDEADYRQRLTAAGFKDIAILDPAALSGSEIEEWAENSAASKGGGCCSADMTRDLTEKIFSAKIWAFKPIA
jgi:SAM-dependent methyltransferase